MRRRRKEDDGSSPQGKVRLVDEGITEIFLPCQNAIAKITNKEPDDAAAIRSNTLNQLKIGHHCELPLFLLILSLSLQQIHKHWHRNTNFEITYTGIVNAPT